MDALRWLDLSWMAWTWPTAAFFVVIFLLLAAMRPGVLSPGGAPRHGILGLDTTRGDRLFISLLGSAYIHLAGSVSSDRSSGGLLASRSFTPSRCSDGSEASGGIAGRRPANLKRTGRKP